MAREEYHGYMDGHEDINFGKYLSVIGFIFLPGGLYALLSYFIFWKILKWKPRVYFFVFLFVASILSLMYLISPPFEDFIFSDFSTYTYPYIYLSAWIGILLSYFSFVYMAGQLRKYPELKVMKGWAANHEFAKTPYQKWKKEQLMKSCRDGNEYDDESTPMGVLDEYLEYNNEKIEVEQIVRKYNAEAIKGGVLSVGAPGSGKSVTMLNSIKNSIIAGNPVIVMDNKKAKDFPYFLAKWAQENNREFFHFQSGRPGEYINKYNEEQASYDPLSSGNSQSKKELILNLRKWDTASEVYRVDTESILQTVFTLLEEAQGTNIKHINWNDSGFEQFISAMDVVSIQAMLMNYQKDLKEYGATNSEYRKFSLLTEFYNKLQSREGLRAREQMNGIITQISTIIQSSYGYWLSKDYSNKTIDLTKILAREDGPVVLFSFSTQEEGDAATFMGNLVLSDLQRAIDTTRQRTGVNHYAEVYMDEFQNLVPERVESILAKSRSANIGFYVSCQSLEQLISSAEKDGQAAVGSLLDTCGNFIIHSGATYQSGERFSNIVGKEFRIAYKKSGKRNAKLFTFQWSNSREEMISEVKEEVWKLSPQDIMELESPNKSNNYRATAYYITKSCLDENYSHIPGAIARKIQVVVPPEITNGVPKEVDYELNQKYNENISKTARERRTNIRRKVDPETELAPSNHTYTDEESNFQVLPMTSNEIEEANKNIENSYIPDDYIPMSKQIDNKVNNVIIEDLIPIGKPTKKEQEMLEEETFETEDLFDLIQESKKENKKITKKKTDNHLAAFDMFSNGKTVKESELVNKKKTSKGLPKL